MERAVERQNAQRLLMPTTMVFAIPMRIAYQMQQVKREKEMEPELALATDKDGAKVKAKTL